MPLFVRIFFVILLADLFLFSISNGETIAPAGISQPISNINVFSPQIGDISFPSFGGFRTPARNIVTGAAEPAISNKEDVANVINDAFVGFGKSAHTVADNVFLGGVTGDLGFQTQQFRIGIRNRKKLTAKNLNAEITTPEGGVTVVSKDRRAVISNIDEGIQVSVPTLFSGESLYLVINAPKNSKPMVRVRGLFGDKTEPEGSSIIYGSAGGDVIAGGPVKPGAPPAPIAPVDLPKLVPVPESDRPEEKNLILGLLDSIRNDPDNGFVVNPNKIGGDQPDPNSLSFKVKVAFLDTVISIIESCSYDFSKLSGYVIKRLVDTKAINPEEFVGSLIADSGPKIIDNILERYGLRAALNKLSAGLLKMKADADAARNLDKAKQDAAKRIGTVAASNLPDGDSRKVGEDLGKAIMGDADVDVVGGFKNELLRGLDEFKQFLAGLGYK